MAFDTSNKQVVLFGGRGNSANLNDTWRLSFDSMTQTYTWSNATRATSPPGLRAASMAFDTSSEQVILFGGKNSSSTCVNNTWKSSFDLTTLTYIWHDITPTLITPPSARDQTSMAFNPSSGQIILFGGEDNNFNFLNDTWALSFDSTTLTYTWAIVNPVTTPYNRAFASMAFDQSSGQSILFGGQDEIG